MIQTLVDEIQDRKAATINKELILGLTYLYGHPVSKEMLYEFFDKRVFGCVHIFDARVTESGIDIENKIHVNGAPYPYPQTISELITICSLEGCLSNFDWNVDVKIKYGIL